jgi:hypothetical protein
MFNVLLVITNEYLQLFSMILTIIVAAVLAYTLLLIIRALKKYLREER